MRYADVDGWLWRVVGGLARRPGQWLVLAVLCVGGVGAGENEQPIPPKPGDVRKIKLRTGQGFSLGQGTITQLKFADFGVGRDGVWPSGPDFHALRAGSGRLQCVGPKQSLDEIGEPKPGIGEREPLRLGHGYWLSLRAGGSVRIRVIALSEAPVEKAGTDQKVEVELEFVVDPSERADDKPKPQ